MVDDAKLAHQFALSFDRWVNGDVGFRLGHGSKVAMFGLNKFEGFLSYKDGNHEARYFRSREHVSFIGN